MKCILWAVILLLLPTCAEACSCIGPTPICSAYWTSPVIFRGKVIEQTLLRPAPQPVKNPDGSTDTIIGPGKYRIRFAVAETFRGKSEREIIVYTNEQSSACGFPFEDGKEYVVFTYADRESSELSTSHCSHTHEVTDDDLRWMRGLSKAPAGASIFGTITIPGEGNERQDANVRLRGAVNRDLVPSANGAYAATGLPPGAYTLSATVPAGFVTDGPRSVTVADKGCAQVDWRVQFNGHIGGQVMDVAGTAIADLPVELSRQDANSAIGYSTVSLVTTDAHGRYEFAPVAPGDYYVAANSLGPSRTRPYPRVYYPDAESREAAAAVHLEASASLDNIGISLPKAWTPVTVHTRVVMPNGMPAANAEVEARDLAALWSVEPSSAETGDTGTAELTVYAGRTYYLTGLVNGTQQRCGGPLKFTAQAGMTLPAITIIHNWGNCLAQLNPGFTPPR
jgi:Carboxypeptidase regulatory-like domain